MAQDRIKTPVQVLAALRANPIAAKFYKIIDGKELDLAARMKR